MVDPGVLDMFKFSSGIKTVAGLALALFCFLSVGSFVQAETVYQLDNGMNVILMENHSSPMVASVIFVKSGAKYETKYENGITHFLEHLLFDGTAHLTREEISNSIEDRGGYINAFTRKELTAYLVLLPSQYIDDGLKVQADMLFNSQIPDEQLPKERKVVIEEIRRDADSPTSSAEKFFTQHAYDGTAYARPVLGYEAFIENIPRAAIIDYWKRNYIPSKMTTLIIGDFNSDTMKVTMEKIFGPFSNKVHLANMADTTIVNAENAMPAPKYKTELVGQIRYDTVANVTSTYIDISINAPSVHDSDYYAFDLLTQYLAMGEISPLENALISGENPMATEASIYLNTYEEFSRLELEIVTDKNDMADRIITTVFDQLKAIGSHQANPETIEGIKTTVKCDEIYNAEKLHYYGFMIAPMIFNGGWDFIQHYADNIAATSWRQAMQSAKKWLSNPSYVVTVVKPAGDNTEAAFKPEVLAAADVIAHFDSTKFANYDMAPVGNLTFDTTKTEAFALTDDAEYLSETLANGLTVIVKSSPDSRVFAMNILGKHRTVNEPIGMEGITDFVNHMVEKGTLTRSAAELSRDLSKIGANVTLYDNPWIPYDDRYTSRRFSFMKFETIDDFAERGFNLFSEMLLDPAFDSSEVENVRGGLLGTLGRNAASGSKIAKNLFYQLLLGDQPMARPVAGTSRSIASISAADLKAYHDAFYSPENMILTIVTGHPIPEVMNWVQHRFGRLTSYGFESKVPTEPEPILEIRTAHTDLESEQVNIYLGGKLPAASSPDQAAIAVATRILSDRLWNNLREKQGLAYSVGAGSTFDQLFGWYYCAMGTGSANYQTAVDGIILEIEKLTLDGPQEGEIESARNRIWGRLMSAKLSRINQAYYLGLNNYLGRSEHYDKDYLAQLQKVEYSDIRRVFASYFRTDAYLLATAGKK